MLNEAGVRTQHLAVRLSFHGSHVGQTVPGIYGKVSINSNDDTLMASRLDLYDPRYDPDRPYPWMPRGTYLQKR